MFGELNMKNKKEWIYSIGTILIIVIIGGGFIVKQKLEAPFNMEIKAMYKAISEGNLKEANIEYNKALDEKYSNESTLLEANIALSETGMSKEQYEQGKEDLNKGQYKDAINYLQEIRTKKYIKKSQQDLNTATTKFLNEEFNKLEPELNARHYMEAYSTLQNEASFIQNKSMIMEYLNKIKALENTNNISLYKATGIVINKINEAEENIHTMVGVVNNNYITYSYPTGKINFITKEQNGIIDGQEGFLYLVEQAQRDNSNLNHLNSYFYVFVNMNSGKVNIYDESILKNFKSNFKVIEFTGADPVAAQYMKEFNIPNCFMALEGLLREQNENKITHLESLYNENKFINEIPGYMELYNKPHQLFSAYGNEYYLVTPEEIYKIQDNKLVKEGKPKLNQENI